MKRSIRVPRLLLLALLFGILVLMTGCVTTVTPSGGDEKTYRVMLSVDEGCTVTSENPLDVEKGGSATFSVEFAEGYIFESISGGSFDPLTNTVTVENVVAKTSVTLSTEEADYDTTATYRYYCYFDCPDWDRSDPVSDTQLKAGTKVTVTAGNTQRIFIGWSFTKRGTDIVSTDRTFTFTVTPELANERGVVGIYSCYSDANTFYYDANGGCIDAETDNAKGNEYLSVESIGEDTLKITLSSALLEYAATPTAFYNDGTFYRDGYLLKEYNTAPDGTGTSYAPGDKVNHVSSDGDFTLYCIWEEESKLDLFTYSEYTYPDGDEALSLVGKHGFVSSGIVIDSYTGGELTVAIPDSIDGKPVIGINTGAFTDRTRMKELVLPRTIQFISDGAFVGCTSLTKMVYPTSVVSATDAILDEVTKSSLKTLFTYHATPPVYANGEPGGFSVKLSRLMTTSAQNRIVVLGGSSAYQGVASAYMERLFDYDYTLINFGTTRTTHGALYLEAITPYLHEGDIVVYAPENSIYMMGDNHLYWKTLRDMEMMGNLFKNVDISKYEDVFDAFSDYAKNHIYQKSAQSYEDIVLQAQKTNKYGDETKYSKASYVNEAKYIAAYTVTFTGDIKSIVEFGGDKWDGNDVDYDAENDYTDPENTAWVKMDDAPYLTVMNAAIDRAKTSGADILFGFCPVDEDAVVQSAHNGYVPSNYKSFIAQNYHFDSVLGDAKKYVYAHEYFYDCAFHLNNYGRAIHSYQLYLDLCDYVGITDITRYDEYNAHQTGCLFEGVDYQTGQSYTHTLRKYMTKIFS